MPERDDRALFEKLLLDGFQAGLSWITILRKRDNFRRAFDGFEPETIAGYGKRKVNALMNDAGIVRNRAKIEGAIVSARGYLDIMEKGPGFSALLWNFVDGEPVVNHRRGIGEVPAETPVSRAHLQGARVARLQVRRADHRLRLHAGGRHGQRPSREVPLPPGQCGELNPSPSSGRAGWGPRAQRAKQESQEQRTPPYLPEGGRDFTPHPYPPRLQAAPARPRSPRGWPRHCRAP